MHLFYRAMIFLLMFGLPCGHALAAQFAAVGDKEAADLATVVVDVAGADVIFIGETHDNAQHHAAQLDILRALHARKQNLAIGLEMFTTEDQPALDDWIGGKLDEEAFKPIFARNWSYGWPLYRELFVFARDNQIPLVALNIPKVVMARVMAQGSSVLRQGELPPKFSGTLNEAQSRYIRAIARQVFGNPPPERQVARLSQAQALRNTVMAWHVVEHRQQRGVAKVVVLAGTWHAVKNGVPELLATYGELTFKVILPELPEFSLEKATVNEADYLIMR